MLEKILDPKLFCPFNGFCTKTCQETVAKSACLYLTDAQETALFTLLHAKGQGAYTRLVISNGVCAEEITLQLHADAMRLCERPKQDYPAGSSLTYETTQAAVADMMTCIAAEAAEAAGEVTSEDQAAKIPGYKFTEFDDNGAPCYEAIPPDCEFIVDGQKITISDGTITCCDATADELSDTCADGTYCGINSITIKDGLITHVDACEFNKNDVVKTLDPSAAGVVTC